MMENGKRRKVSQEKNVVIKKSLNEDPFTAQNIKNEFYGGADLRISRIRVISDNPFIIE